MPTETVGLIATYDVTSFLAEVEERRVSTPWGEAEYYLGHLDSQPVALLQRYGREMEMVQHLVNFRANLWGFRELGVRRVIATDGIGSLRQDLAPGTFVVVHDFLDFTKKGSLSFFEEHGCSVRVDLTQPFCPELRAALIAGARQVTEAVREEGVLAAAEGPRFETPAEGRMFRLLGADVVGTLLVPEIVLAREAEICLALLAISINYGPGLAPSVERRGPGSMEDVYFKGPHRAVLSIPLREPTAFATTVVTAREYVIVWVDTDEGLPGMGFTVGGRYTGEGHLIHTAIQHNLKHLIIGQSPFAVERL